MSSLALAKTYVGSLEALSAQARAYAALIDIGQNCPEAAQHVRAILDIIVRQINDLADEMESAK